MIGFQDDADWLTLWPISLSLQSMKTDLRLQRLVGKAQSPTVKMLLGSFPSSFWICATSCAPTSGENIFSIWIVERIEVGDIYKRTRNTEPIPSMNRTRSMFHLYIRHHVMRTAKILKFKGGKIEMAEFEWARPRIYVPPGPRTDRSESVQDFQNFVLVRSWSKLVQDISILLVLDQPVLVRGPLSLTLFLPSSLPTSSTLTKSYGSVFQSDFGTRLTRNAKPTCS